ncbi:uncharacterized protein N7515_005477 [Penicillium bovifimosum]|uniref:Uncharacterized protein n=1 Tax=Penicillium bovifimosum TaxID=126998 RepID=A0A9W9KYT8_9EURO|nr:uncharacterized protein N7515_005477 [Penicillium bovifimosum]KAJ5129438.1 hypothetical protein N7515_005477 [Penicillium bovifimosum]
MLVPERYTGITGYNCKKQAKARSQKTTYNSEDSLVVTHPTTNSPACGLSTAERTGSPVLHTLWSYVLNIVVGRIISNKELDQLKCTHYPLRSTGSIGGIGNQLMSREGAAYGSCDYQHV